MFIISPAHKYTFALQLGANGRAVRRPNPITVDAMCYLQPAILSLRSNLITCPGEPGLEERNACSKGLRFGVCLAAVALVLAQLPLESSPGRAGKGCLCTACSSSFEGWLEAGCMSSLLAMRLMAKQDHLWSSCKGETVALCVSLSFLGVGGFFCSYSCFEAC